MRLPINWKLVLTLPLFMLGVVSLTACSSKFTPRTTELMSAPKPQLTEQDVLDIDPTLEVTEADIQQAIKVASSETFQLAPKSRIILVQSGEPVPDSVMQEAMMKYYRVSVYSGIPPTKARLRSARKNDAASPLPEHSYIKTLRLAAAKAKQDKIVVYWGNLELGRFDQDNKTIVWDGYVSGNIPSSTKYLRYLIRFAIVDVKTGMWVMYSPTNNQNEFVNSSFKTYESDVLQINKIKEESYEFAAKDLSVQFEKFNTLKY